MIDATAGFLRDSFHRSLQLHLIRSPSKIVEFPAISNANWRPLNAKGVIELTNPSASYENEGHQTSNPISQYILSPPLVYIEAYCLMSMFLPSTSCQALTGLLQSIVFLSTWSPVNIMVLVRLQQQYSIAFVFGHCNKCYFLFPNKCLGTYGMERLDISLTRLNGIVKHLNKGERGRSLSCALQRPSVRISHMQL